MSEFFPADHPAPAPERELAAWAESMEHAAGKMKGSWKALTLQRAQWIRDMLAKHAAVRERALYAETELKTAQYRLSIAAQQAK